MRFSSYSWALARHGVLPESHGDARRHGCFCGILMESGESVPDFGRKPCASRSSRRGGAQRGISSIIRLPYGRIGSRSDSQTRPPLRGFNPENRGSGRPRHRFLSRPPDSKRTPCRPILESPDDGPVAANPKREFQSITPFLPPSGPPRLLCQEPPAKQIPCIQSVHRRHLADSFPNSPGHRFKCAGFPHGRIHDHLLVDQWLRLFLVGLR